MKFFGFFAVFHFYSVPVPILDTPPVQPLPYLHSTSTPTPDLSMPHKLTIKTEEEYGEGFPTVDQIEILLDGIKLDGVSNLKLHDINPARGGLVFVELTMTVQPDFIDIPVTLDPRLSNTTPLSILERQGSVPRVYDEEFYKPTSER
jgi:hypothetical protein